MKQLSLKIIALGLSLATSTFASAQCQHPYCNGPVASTPEGTSTNSSPTIYNSQYCDEGRCYPGAYIPGALDKSGDVSNSAESLGPTSAADRLKAELAQVGVAQFTDTNYKPGVIKHIVLFRYGSDVTAAEKNEVIARFLALKKLSVRNGKNYIVSIQTGADNSGEGADQGLEQGFIVTFKSEGDRNYYVGQPVVTDSHYYEAAHQKFKDFVGPLLDKNGALVFDFSAK